MPTKGLMLTAAMVASLCFAELSAEARVVFLHSKGNSYKVLANLLVLHMEAQEELNSVYQFEATNDPEGDGNLLSGSMDIINYLANHSQNQSEEIYYLGFAQSDVAYYFRNGGHPLYPAPHPRKDDVVALARSLSEYFHIYCHGSEKGLLNDYSPESWDSVYLGDLGSGTLITAVNLLPIIGERPSAVLGESPRRKRLRLPSPRGSSQTERKKWAGVLVSAWNSPSISTLLDSGGSLLSLNAAQRRHITNAYSQFYKVVQKRLPHSSDMGWFVQVPSLVIADRRLPVPVVDGVLDFFRRIDGESFRPDGLGKGLNYIDGLVANAHNRGSGLFEADFIQTLKLGLSATSGKQNRYSGLPLPLHRSSRPIRRDYYQWELAILLFFGSIAFLIWSRARPGAGKKTFWLEIPKLTALIALLAAIAYLHLILVVASCMEIYHFKNHDMTRISPLASQSYPELFPKVVHYVASAFSSEDLIPVSYWGQIVWLTIPIALAAGAFASAVPIVVQPAVQYFRSALEGGLKVNLKDHIVICNWHEHAADVIRQLQKQSRVFGNPDSDFLVISKNISDIDLAHMAKERFDEGLGEYHIFSALPESGGLTRSSQDSTKIIKVLAIADDPQNRRVLQRARVDQASSVIVFPDMSLPSPDSPTALTVLNIEAFLGKNGKLGSVKVIVWCADPRNVEVFRSDSFHLTDACSTEWAWRIICQATAVPRVSNIYRRLMTATEDTNEFYELELPPEWEEKSPRQTQMILDRFNDGPCGKIRIGNEEVRNSILFVGYAEEADLRRERIHLNPDPHGSKVKPGDSLLFLTYAFTKEQRKKLASFLLENQSAQVCKS